MSSPQPQNQTLAPGARVIIRDEEWIVRTCKDASHGGQAVHVEGSSELVRGKEATFLTALDTVKVLRPEQTELVDDLSPRYRRSRLYIESLLRRTPPTDAGLYVGHRGAIDITNYQMQPATKALSQPRPRILMADGVGLGKTIEVGILLSELIARGRGERILVVALKSILAQFQEELWARFTIPLVRLDSVGIQRVQTKIPTNMNPFYYYNRAIISIDTLKDQKYLRYLEDSRWDVVVVDECQNVAVRTKGGSTKQSQRARLAQLLAGISDGLILTSATPHDGSAKSFASLMNLLEPYAVADEENYEKEDVEDLFLRRFKKDIAHELEEGFQERLLFPRKIPASGPEDEVFEIINKIEFKTINRQRNGKGILFRTLLLKAFLSSPAACSSTVQNRLDSKALQDESSPEVEHDREALLDLQNALQVIAPTDFPKYQALLEQLKELGFDKKGCNERVVIFSERIDTLDSLIDQLCKDLPLKQEGKDRGIAAFHGSLDDQDQKRLVKSFGSGDSKLRILLASDAASEGINLHFFCHRMIHFDLPWSLITLEQRNGRIDRYGQKHQPEISYLLTIPGDPELQGDLRVLERLIEKEESAQKNLGDVAWLMNLHDAEKEEDHIGKGIEERRSPEDVIPEEPAEDFLTSLFGSGDETGIEVDLCQPLRLFPDDLSYAREALQAILPEGDTTTVQWDDRIQGFELYLPEDLKQRYKYLPRELQTGKDALKLTVDRELVMKALEDSRQYEDRWPEYQLFWEQHPVALWLDDRVLSEFARHEAPIIQMTSGLQPDESIFLFQAMLSNSLSQPLHVSWFGIPMTSGVAGEPIAFNELIQATIFNATLANSGKPLREERKQQLTKFLPDAVRHAEEYMEKQRKHRAAELHAPVKESISKLMGWRKARHLSREVKRQQLESSGKKLRKDQRDRLDSEIAREEALVDDRRNWLNSMKTTGTPYLRVAAVMIQVDQESN